MAFPRVFDVHRLVIGLVYLAAYAVLDWISFIEPYANLGITAWNPGTGLSFALLLLFGLRMIPFLLISPLLADLLDSAIRHAVARRDPGFGAGRRRLFDRIDDLVAEKIAV